MLIGLCYSLQSQADGWVIIDTVGIVSIEIEATNSDSKENRRLERILIKRVRKTAKKLNKRAKHDQIFNEIFLYETGENGEVHIGGIFEREEDSSRLTGLSILIPRELFSEEMVMRLYSYGVLIKDRLSSEEPVNISGSNLLKRINTCP